MDKIREEIAKIFAFDAFDDTVKKAFGNSLRELREYCQITLKDLSKATEIPFQSLSVYERGKTAPSIAQAYRIAFYFGLSVDDFIEYGLNSYGIFNNDYKSIVDKYENESENK